MQVCSPSIRLKQQETIRPSIAIHLQAEEFVTMHKDIKNVYSGLVS